MMKRITAGLLLLIVPLIHAVAQPLRVAVAVPPQAWLVEQLAGSEVEITIMVPPGNSPETWSPTPGQYRRLADAELYFSIGHSAFLLEANHIHPFLENRPDVRVVEMYSERDTLDFLLPGELADLDPHVWLSPAVMRNAAERLETVLATLLPERNDLLQTRLVQLEFQLDSLDHFISSKLATLSQRQFLVQHPAWGWYAAQYGLDQLAVEHQCKEPAPTHIIHLIDQARELGLQAVFVQRGFPDQAAATVAGELNIPILEMDPLATEWLDNMYHITNQLKQVLEQEHE